MLACLRNAGRQAGCFSLVVVCCSSSISLYICAACVRQQKRAHTRTQQRNKRLHDKPKNRAPYRSRVRKASLITESLTVYTAAVLYPRLLLAAFDQVARWFTFASFWLLQWSRIGTASASAISSAVVLATYSTVLCVRQRPAGRRTDGEGTV